MNPQTAGIIIGGVVAALFFGISGIFAKASTQAGIGTGLYVICAGAAIMIVGVFYYTYQPDKTISAGSGLYAAGMGACWGVGVLLVSIALAKYGLPVGKLAPIYNCNTLVTVAGGLLIYSEWKEADPTKIIIGALLVVLGGTLAANG